ncbi:MAG TPA: hypothetical protein VND22_06710 [Actinomycetota bacterium]|nr:hypothetical protein [Actinomycetota bacterium]
MATSKQDKTFSLEQQLRTVSGVVGAVVLEKPPDLSEVQVFCRAGARDLSLRADLEKILQESGHEDLMDRLVLHELAAHERPSGDVGRPLITSVTVDDHGNNSVARINLVLGDTESEGRGQGDQTEYSLRVVAATALEAAQAFIEKPGTFELQGVSLIEALQQRIVLVLVRSELAGGRLTLGASLVADGAVHEATVKAALDAVNRQLGLALSS